MLRLRPMALLLVLGALILVPTTQVLAADGSNAEQALAAADLEYEDAESLRAGGFIWSDGLTGLSEKTGLPEKAGPVV